jgi:molybdopterin-biosynthesis enzyme MoeA-like protein
MAGVPRIMQAMFEEARQHITGGSRVMSRGLVIDLGEGTIAEGLALVQARYRDIDIGSYPQMRQQVGFRVSVVLRGTDAGQLERAHAEVMQIMRDLGGNPVEEDPERSQASAEPES